MFLRLREIHRPRSLEDALSLLARPGVKPLAGGTATVGPVDAETTELVDLSGLGLRYLEASDAALRIGATTPLLDLRDFPMARLVGSGVLVSAIDRAAPPTALARATLGGTVCRPERMPELVAVLLALDAAVEVRTAGDPEPATVSLAGLQRDRGHLVTAVILPLNTVRLALERVARTPRDIPTVAVVAALRWEEGRCVHARIAAAGLSAAPRRLAAAEEVLLGQAPTPERVTAAAAAARAAVEPPDDLRGTAEYRAHLAEVLVRRAVAAAAGLQGRV